MKVTQSGTIACECGNQELVFTKTEPNRYTFLITCRKCGRLGIIVANPDTVQALSDYANRKGR